MSLPPVVSVVTIAEAVPDVPPNGPVLLKPLVLSDRSPIMGPFVELPRARASSGEYVQDFAMFRCFRQLIPSVRLLHHRVRPGLGSQIGGVAA